MFTRAVMKDARTMPREEECVGDMGQSEKLLAVTKNAPTLPRKEEPKQRNAAGLPAVMKDALTLHRSEE